MAAAIVGAEAASGLAKTLVDALNKPIYSNLETTVVVHKAENGDVVTRTRVKGYTIPVSLVLGSIFAFGAWEVGLAVAKGIQTIENGVADAATVLNPVNWVNVAVDDVGNLVGTMTADLNKAGAYVWDWLDGSGATHSSPPPSATKTFARPPTPMASMANLLQGFTDPAGAISQKLSQVVAAKLG